MFDPFPYELSIKDSNHLPKILSAVSSITFDKSVLFLTFLESTRGLHERITREDYTRGLHERITWKVSVVSVLDGSQISRSYFTQLVLKLGKT